MSAASTKLLVPVWTLPGLGGIITYGMQYSEGVRGNPIADPVLAQHIHRNNAMRPQKYRTQLLHPAFVYRGFC